MSILCVAAKSTTWQKTWSWIAFQDLRHPQTTPPLLCENDVWRLLFGHLPLMMIYTVHYCHTTTALIANLSDSSFFPLVVRGIGVGVLQHIFWVWGSGGDPRGWPLSKGIVSFVMPKKKNRDVFVEKKREREIWRGTVFFSSSSPPPNGFTDLICPKMPIT